MTDQSRVKAEELKQAYFVFKTTPDTLFECAADGSVTHSSDRDFNKFCKVARSYLADDLMVSYLWDNNQPMLISLVGFFTGINPLKVSIERDRLYLGDETYILRMEVSFRFFPEGDCPAMPESANPIDDFMSLISKAALLYI